MGKTTSMVFKCVQCGDPAKLVCSGCRAENFITKVKFGTTRYCGTSCQKQHWPRHKVYCKAFKAIQKSGSIELELHEDTTEEAQPSKVETSKLRASESQSQEIPAKEINSSSVENSKIDRPEFQTYESQPRDIQASDSSPYEVRSHDVSASGVHEAHQTEQVHAQPEGSHTCALCHKLATITCSDCKGAPNAIGGLVAPTYYCTPSCQKDHLSAHKETCQAAQSRRKLYEIGAVLHKGYHGYCQGLVIAMLATLTLNPNHMIIHQRNSELSTTHVLRLLQEISMSAEGMSAEDQHAFLACLVGSDYSGKMGLAIKQQLKGLYTSIREVTLSLKPSLRRLFTPQDWQATQDKHKILHVLLKTKTGQETYALDLSGVQFGLVQPVVPWKEYVEKSVRQVEKVEVFDVAK